MILPKPDCEFAICCSIALVFVYLKAIYLVASAFVINISLRNPFIVQPLDNMQLTLERRMVCRGGIRSRYTIFLSPKLILDFLAALLCVVGGFLAPRERRDATRAYDAELDRQQNGGGGFSGRYNWATNPGPNKEETSYAQAWELMSCVGLSLIYGLVFLVDFGLYFAYTYMVLVNWDYPGTFTCWDCGLILIDIRFQRWEWSILEGTP